MSGTFCALALTPCAKTGPANSAATMTKQNVRHRLIGPPDNSEKDRTGVWTELYNQNSASSIFRLSFSPRRTQGTQREYSITFYLVSLVSFVVRSTARREQLPRSARP